MKPKHQNLKPIFVDYIPSEVEPNCLYISIRFATATHHCICGCGNEVVTPLSPTDWKIVYDGKSVSLYPSIGNWGFKCNSHYWIKNNCVILAEKWTADKIRRNRNSDKLQKHECCGSPGTCQDIANFDLPSSRKKLSTWKKIKIFLFGDHLS